MLLRSNTKTEASCAPGIDGGSQPGRTGSHDDEVKVLVHTKFLQTGGGKAQAPPAGRLQMGDVLFDHGCIDQLFDLTVMTDDEGGSLVGGEGRGGGSCGP